MDARIDERGKRSDLEAELARSRIFEAAFRHLRDVADDEAAWTLKFELSWMPSEFERESITRR